MPGKSPGGLFPRPVNARPPREPRGRTYTAPVAKKPAKPLTKAMRDGKEPLRTFGDLKQFLDKREAEPGQPDEKA